jgi:hypothetical protein
MNVAEIGGRQSEDPAVWDFRVGLSRGGGYPFSQDIFQALVRAEGLQHQHQFYVMDSGHPLANSVKDVFQNKCSPERF